MKKKKAIIQYHAKSSVTTLGIMKIYVVLSDVYFVEEVDFYGLF